MKLQLIINTKHLKTHCKRATEKTIKSNNKLYM